MAVEFVRYDEKNPQEMERYKRAVALIKEKQVSVANLDLLKPGDVVRIVKERTGKHFGQHQHVQCWRFFHVRPASGDPNPASCDNRFCFYDAAHRDYLYAQAWVDHLVRELADENRYAEICSRKTP